MVSFKPPLANTVVSEVCFAPVPVTLVIFPGKLIVKLYEPIFMSGISNAAGSVSAAA